MDKLKLLLQFFIIFLCALHTINAKDYSIRINSIPAKAKVYLNDEYIGTTPIELKNYDLGTYKFSIEDERYDPYKTTLYYYQQKDVYVYPILDGDYGIIKLTCSESNSEVFIDDSLYGITPLNEIKLDAGIHNFKIVKTDFKVAKETINVKPEVKEINIMMTYLYSFVTINDTSDYSKFVIDGIEVANSDLNQKKILSGSHSFAYKKSDDIYGDEINYKVNPGSEYRVVVEKNRLTFKPFFQSFLVPGLGQYMDNHKVKGVAFFGGTVLSGVLFYAMQSNYDTDRRDYNNKRTNYLNAQSEVEAAYYRGLMKDAESKANKSETYRNVSMGVIVGVYLYSWVDALLNHSTKDRIKIVEVKSNLYPKAQGVQFNMSIPLK